MKRSENVPNKTTNLIINDIVFIFQGFGGIYERILPLRAHREVSIGM
jgi:hypothetical protein